MKNRFRVEGDTAFIRLNSLAATRTIEAAVDVADLPLLTAINCTWRAYPARAPIGKFYATAKRYDPETSKSKTILMHRVIAGEATPYDVHHYDNDGLNNRRSNLSACTHKENLRARQPEKDWPAYDESEERLRITREIMEISRDIQAHHGISRQQMFAIRKGRVRSGPARTEFWATIRERLPDLFMDAGAPPHLAIRGFLIRKPAD